MRGSKNAIGCFLLPTLYWMGGFDVSAEPLSSSTTQSVETTVGESVNTEINSEIEQSNVPIEEPDSKPVLSGFTSNKVAEVYKDKRGQVLLFNGEPYFIRGMNWGYVPIGTNYSYNFWAEPEWMIKAALDKEMRLLQQMGVNSIRQYNGIPPKWVTYIYQNYGITTMINHTVGRYGMEIDGNWVPVTNYADPRTRELLKAEVKAVVEQYKDVEGVLLWLLGNENNYGLHWSSFEIEQLPKDEQYQEKAKHLYSLMGEITDEIHALDTQHPVGIANGDVQYIDLIAQHAPNLDLFGTNVYRGVSVRDLYQVVEDTLDIPVFFSEFGSDAYNAKTKSEAHLDQAYYLREQWKEIYLNAHDRGVGNAIGGYTFQWADGWWKYLQEENLDVHDTNANWPNGGYEFDFVDGQNNMNEEWFGICAKGFPDENNLFELYPRASYYLLRDAYQISPYATGVSDTEIARHFDRLEPSDYDFEYTARVGLAEAEQATQFRVKDIRTHMYSFGADRGQGNGRQMQHLESFFVDLEGEPSADLKGELSLNILGNVPDGRIDELYYEARGRRFTVEGTSGSDGVPQEITIQDNERLQVYAANIEWRAEQFDMTAFYRGQGHYHWAHEGDFFNFYREAHYGPNPDIYNAAVPIGAEFDGRNSLEGWKLAIGPQIYWGANPTAILKYEKQLGSWYTSVVHQEDVANQGAITTLNAIPEQPLRRSAFYASRNLGSVKAELGLLLSGLNKVGQSFQRADQAIEDGVNYAGSDYTIIDDQVFWADALGGKARLTKNSGRVLWYGQSGYQGVVADAGSDQDVRFTGWQTRNSGRGNHWHAMGGFAFGMGNIQIAPHILTQKPLVGPMPRIEGSISNNGIFHPTTTPRSLFSAPFMVLENRETTIGELLIAYDQTPGTWMWYWDNDIKEDAKVSGYVSLRYIHQPTTRDATIGFDEYGTLFAFSDAPEAADLWEVNSRLILNADSGARLVLNTQVGTAQSGGDDSRVIQYTRLQVRGWHNNLHTDWQFKFNDWGPFDYHRVYNLTFPFQTIGRLEMGMTKPRYGNVYPRIGVLSKFRLTDEFSPDHIPMAGWANDWGRQYEVGAYVSFAR